MMKTIITWDLGATNCAAAIVAYDPHSEQFSCTKSASVKLSACNSLEELIYRLEHALSIHMQDADAICIGAAGHYDGSHLIHTSPYPYTMPFAQIAQLQKWPPFAIIHDYAPIVCATFTDYVAQAHNVRKLNSAPLNKFGRRVTLGVGTGLGLKDGVLLESGDFWLGQNEFGHIGITTPPLCDPAQQQRHQELIKFLRSEQVLTANEPLTFEKILSGQGTLRLYRFLTACQQTVSPEEVGTKMREGQAKELETMFAWYLGLFVGTVQLAFMANGGTWITGGVILNHLNLFDYPDFMQGIEASPAYLSLRQSFPLGVLCNREHAFMGGAFYASKRLLR